MASTAPAQTQPVRGGNRGGRRGNRGRGRNTQASGRKEAVITPPVTEVQASENVSVEAGTDEDGAEVCWICAEPVKYYSVSQCNHRTCHVCALRLRALYKKMDCAFCKEGQPTVIFTTSPDALYQSFTDESIPFKDEKLAISFETEDMMEETLILLRFNCPDPECDYIGKGWGDLKLHVRATHNKLMCEICIRSKKVFAHEHALYTYAQLCVHLPSMSNRQNHKAIPKDQIEGGVHPMCEFCRQSFFSGDELYSHMRETHEECFICKRNEVRDQYFLNYNSLEKHFNTAHHPCTQASCQAQKFVVFGTLLDLKGHMVEQHGADLSSRDLKDIRRVEAEFQFEEVGGRRRGRDPPSRQQAQQPPPPVPGPSRPTGGGGRRREAFGGTLTPSGGSNGATPTQSGRASPSAPSANLDPVTLERHSAFIAKLQAFAPNNTTAVPVVKAAVRGFRSSETNARDLILTIWNVLDRHLENTASIVNAFVDLLDDEEDRKKELLESWRDFDIEQRRQFPELVPTSIGSGYAGIASGRVLNAKHSTATRSAQRTSRQVWDRVAQAASSSSSSVPRPAISSNTPRSTEKFPPLRTAASIPGAGPAFRQSHHTTAWSPSATGHNHNTVTIIPAQPRPVASRQQPPPNLSRSLFPELPVNTTSRIRPIIKGNSSLNNILGITSPPASVWGSGNRDTSLNTSSGATDSESTAVSNGKKKGKGKQKQTLFTIGTFPTL